MHLRPASPRYSCRESLTRGLELKFKFGASHFAIASQSLTPMVSDPQQPLVPSSLLAARGSQLDSLCGSQLAVAAVQFFEFSE